MIDGSMSGYYYQKSSGQSDLWVIYLEGGGVCWSYLSVKNIILLYLFTI